MATTTVNGRIGGLRPWLGLLARITGGALGIAAALGAIVLLTASVAHAEGGVGLILQTTAGPVAAPLQSTDLRLRVTGPIVRGTVTQRYSNPGAEWLEGRYLFPLPEDAAVDHLQMRVGDRIVDGEIREREAARRAFAQARRDGQRASLVEQQRPNVFTTRVTQIAPNATIEIRIEFQQTIALKDGVWRLRVPGVVAPRYRGAAASDPPRAPGSVPETTQPVVLDGGPAVNPIRIRVDLDPGLPIGPPRSASHRIEVLPAAGTAFRITTIDGEVADRDFELEWAPAAALLPQASLRHERFRDRYYGIFVITPAPAAATDRLPRETTFVVDTSGSMNGESIDQARAALAFGLARLAPEDRFNIIQFNSDHSSLFDEPVPVTASTLAQARRYVARLRADGGTEMRGAIRQALSAPLAAGLVGQVVFITDGAVDAEDELTALIRDRIGARRLYCVGIGSAPNGLFMRKAAELGGGTFTFISRPGEVEHRMAKLFEKLSQPMSTDLAIRLDGGVLAEPIGMPRDLHSGEPLIVSARFIELPRSIEVSARSGAAGSPRWRIPVDIAATETDGLHVQWARTAIERLSDALRQARHTARPQDTLRAEIVALALDHHLVSDFTSLVAVERTPVRPADAPIRSGDVPANLPAGWDFAAVFGDGAVLPRTATPAAVQLLLGTALLALGFALLLSRRGSRFLASGEPR